MDALYLTGWVLFNSHPWSQFVTSTKQIEALVYSANKRDTIQGVIKIKCWIIPILFLRYRLQFTYMCLISFSASAFNDLSFSLRNLFSFIQVGYTYLSFSRLLKLSTTRRDIKKGLHRISKQCLISFASPYLWSTYETRDEFTLSRKRTISQIISCYPVE